MSDRKTPDEPAKADAVATKLKGKSPKHLSSSSYAILLLWLASLRHTVCTQILKPMTGMNLGGPQGQSTPPTGPVSSAGTAALELITKIQTAANPEFKYVERTHREVGNLKRALPGEIKAILESPSAKDAAAQNLESVNFMIHSMATVVHGVNRTREKLPRVKEVLAGTKNIAIDAPGPFRATNAGLDTLLNRLNALRADLSAVMDMLLLAKEALTKLINPNSGGGRTA
ncbi:uncharacterized protein N7459_008845 [Penicillium hispanicum]|uniref:uncharacterized protein n=1 Tax=Penicillium hispanicum TaxID=1080232 RepID=UPI002540A56D|nr:uncharacterized protein N7459_008845 [Penicillium hispanicum]KAJ5569415.1 hypothetical protein N7459_008845 [Penicillium hispanicum]